MKKYFILLAAVALMAMTACNEKPAKSDDAKDPATEQVDKTIKEVDKLQLFLIYIIHAPTNSYFSSTFSSSPTNALGLQPYWRVKQRVKYFGSLNPTL